VYQPDFLDTCCSGGLQPGIVAFNLGADGKPVYLGTPGPVSTTHGAFYFNEWYNDVDVPGFNESMPYELAFMASPSVAGQFVFSQPTFDPLMVVGDGGAIPDFTLEAHGQILYVGGETYTFSSDDDLWVFINRRLAVDLGGLHPAVSKSINLDSLAGTLGIVKGQMFPLDLFYANREPPGATLMIDIPDTDIWACPR
jgi:fibro-slime domain-containing protein